VFLDANKASPPPPPPPPLTRPKEEVTHSFNKERYDQALKRLGSRAVDAEGAMGQPNPFPLESEDMLQVVLVVGSD
jgi:hypothetical protein